MNIVICGGGIIGSACAYYLAKRNVSCTIIEQEEIACAASGKAGGFLARNWCEKKRTDSLAKLSFNLHMDLSKIFNDVGYRNVNTYSTFIDNKSLASKERAPTLNWLNGPIIQHSLLETDKDTAQVHPKRLCQQFLHEARKLTDYRTTVVFDKVIGLEFDSSMEPPQVTGVKLESGAIVKADKVLIALGPWTGNAVDWLPKNSIPRIKGHRAHSIVIQVPDNVMISADCLFLEYHDDTGTTSPEMYPRPDGTIYICGFDDGKDLPKTSSETEVDSWRCEKLRNIASVACSDLRSAEIVAEQACYLPMSPDDVPVIGSLGTVKGVYIATGHSCWGILNSTGTGYAMAELITTGGSTSIDLAPFDPSRFH